MSQISHIDQEMLERMLGGRPAPLKLVELVAKHRKLRDSVQTGPTPPDVLAMLCLMAGVEVSLDSPQTARKVITDWNEVPPGTRIRISIEQDGREVDQVLGEFLAAGQVGMAQVRVYDSSEPMRDVATRLIAVTEQFTWATVPPGSRVQVLVNGQELEGKFLTRRFNGDVEVSIGNAIEATVIEPWKLRRHDQRPIDTKTKVDANLPPGYILRDGKRVFVGPEAAGQEQPSGEKVLVKKQRALSEEEKRQRAESLKKAREAKAAKSAATADAPAQQAAEPAAV